MPRLFVWLFLLDAFCFWIVVAHRPPPKSKAAKARMASVPAAAAAPGAGAGADLAFAESQTPREFYLHL